MKIDLDQEAVEELPVVPAPAAAAEPAAARGRFRLRKG